MMSDLDRFKKFVKWFREIVFGPPAKCDDCCGDCKPKRARTKKGRYKADNKSTPNVNEAWVGGKAPKKLLGLKKRKK